LNQLPGRRRNEERRWNSAKNTSLKLLDALSGAVVIPAKFACFACPKLKRRLNYTPPRKPSLKHTIRPIKHVLIYLKPFLFAAREVNPDEKRTNEGNSPGPRNLDGRESGKLPGVTTPDRSREVI